MAPLFLPDFWVFCVLFLASFRISRFFVKDFLFAGLRNKIFDRFAPETTQIGYLFTCMWCFGFWTALGVFFCYTILPVLTLWVSYVLAISAVVGLLSALEDRL